MTDRAKQNLFHWIPVALFLGAIIGVWGDLKAQAATDRAATERVLLAIEDHVKNEEIHVPKSWIQEADTKIERGWASERNSIQSTMMSVRNAQEEERRQRERFQQELFKLVPRMTLPNDGG